MFYRDLNNFERAEDYHKKALHIYKEIGDLENEGTENRHLGHLYCFLGKYEEGRKCYESSMVIKEEKVKHSVTLAPCIKLSGTMLRQRNAMSKRLLSPKKQIT